MTATDVSRPSLWHRLRAFVLEIWSVLRRPSTVFSFGVLVLAGFVAGIIFWGGFNNWFPPPPRSYLSDLGLSGWAERRCGRYEPVATTWSDSMPERAPHPRDVPACPVGTRPPARPPQVSHHHHSGFSGWAALPNRGIFDKSHNHQARSAPRLVIEAVYPL